MKKARACEGWSRGDEFVITLYIAVCDCEWWRYEMRKIVLAAAKKSKKCECEGEKERAKKVVKKWDKKSFKIN